MTRALIIAVTLTAATPAHAIDLGYVFGGGVVIPVTDPVKNVAAIGPHIDAGIAYKFYDWMSVALHLSLDFPIPEERPTGVTPVAQFIGVNARLMMHGSVDLFTYWGSVGLGLYFNRLSECTPTHVCSEPATGAKPGMDISAGIGVKVWESLSLGPAVGVTFPAFQQFTDQFFVHTSLRLQWNL